MKGSDITGIIIVSSAMLQIHDGSREHRHQKDSTRLTSRYGKELLFFYI